MKPGGLFIGTPEGFAYSIIWILVLLVVEYVTEYYSDIIKVFYNPNKVLRYGGYVVVVLVIILFGVFNGGQFIYFQF